MDPMDPMDLQIESIGDSKEVQKPLEIAAKLTTRRLADIVSYISGESKVDVAMTAFHLPLIKDGKTQKLMWSYQGIDFASEKENEAAWGDS